MRLSAFALFLLFVPIATAHADRPTRAPRVEMEVIGSVSEAEYVMPNAINNRGQVVLLAVTQGVNNAYLWTRESGFQLIVENAFPRDINDRGDVIGIMDCSPNFCDRSGFIWNAKDGLRDLGGFLPLAVNERGDMAGSCDVIAACALIRGELHVWPTEFGCGAGATAINARGDVVGGLFCDDGRQSAMFWPRHGRDIQLDFSIAFDINNAGLIVGQSLLGLHSVALTRRGMVWTNPQYGPVAEAVNARGWAAGIDYGKGPTQTNTAFVWEPRGI